MQCPGDRNLTHSVEWLVYFPSPFGKKNVSVNFTISRSQLLLFCCPLVENTLLLQSCVPVGISCLRIYLKYAGLFCIFKRNFVSFLLKSNLYSYIYL